MISMFGGKTLQELQQSFLFAEQEREAGISHHVSPFAMITDVGNVLSGAGFRLPTSKFDFFISFLFFNFFFLVDSEEIVIRYPSAWMLMQELGMMGESNAVLLRRERTPFDTLLAAASYYQNTFQLEDGTIPATFEVGIFTKNESN